MKLEVTDEELTVIMNAVVKEPFHAVYTIVDKIQRQLQEQPPVEEEK